MYWHTPYLMLCITPQYNSSWELFVKHCWVKYDMRWTKALTTIKCAN
jgi:hypothetical protein